MFLVYRKFESKVNYTAEKMSSLDRKMDFYLTTRCQYFSVLPDHLVRMSLAWPNIHRQLHER